MKKSFTIIPLFLSAYAFAGDGSVVGPTGSGHVDIPDGGQSDIGTLGDNSSGGVERHGDVTGPS